MDERTEGRTDGWMEREERERPAHVRLCYLVPSEPGCDIQAHQAPRNYTSKEVFVVSVRWCLRYVKGSLTGIWVLTVLRLHELQRKARTADLGAVKPKNILKPEDALCHC